MLVFLYIYIAMKGALPENNIEPIVWLKDKHLYLLFTGNMLYKKLCNKAGVGAKLKEINIIQDKIKYMFSIFKLINKNILITREKNIENFTILTLPILSEKSAVIIIEKPNIIMQNKCMLEWR